MDTWSLTIPDDEVIKIVNYTNKKITELHAIIEERLRETDKKSHYMLMSLTEIKSMVWVVVFACSIETQYNRHTHFIS